MKTMDSPQQHELQDQIDELEEEMIADLGPNAERIIRHWILHSKMIMIRLGKSETHKFIDMIADEISHYPTQNKEIKEGEMTSREREFGETKEKLKEILLPEDDEFTHSVDEVFLNGGSNNE